MNLEELVIKIYNLPLNQLNADTIKQYKRQYSKDNKLANLPTNIQIIKVYNDLVKSRTIKRFLEFENIIRKRSIRSLSWIVPVQVLMKPHPCPWQCIFCPNDFCMPKSYINTEPWAMRALLNEFDPYKQVYNRLLSLKITWHSIDKIEMIVLGWSFDAYPNDYKITFIKWLYDACNCFDEFFDTVKLDENNPKSAKFSVSDGFNIKYSRTLEESIKINETASCRIIWLTIETRADFVNDQNCQFRRRIWVTRIEMWVQSLFDDVLEANLRWNTTEQIKHAIHKLRSYWFKISLHFMPWLYKSSIEKDIATMQIAFDDIYIRPDEIKFYPTSVIPNTKLHELYLNKEYIPLEEKEIKYIIEQTKLQYIPPYTRLKRVIRDIPENEIIAWSKKTNLRQIILGNLLKKFIDEPETRKNQYKRLYWNYKLFNNIDEFIKFDKDNKIDWNWFFSYIIWYEPDIESIRNFTCLCTRCREIRNKPKQDSNDIYNTIIRKYISSTWYEYFISFEDKNGYLFWFCRLMIPNENFNNDFDWLWKNTWLIRELHVYWQMAKLNSDENKDQIQHSWFGRKLMNIAENIAVLNWKNKLTVISWIWVRQYYANLWYELVWTYMTKEFTL